MAAYQQVLEALNNLADEVLEASSLAETFMDIADGRSGDEATRWTFVVARHVRRLQRAAEEVDALVRQRALPILQDMEGVSGVQRAKVAA